MVEPGYIASRYDGITAGPSLFYSFEEQDGIPVDGSRALPRNLSPFTLRFVLPDIYLASYRAAGNKPSPDGYLAAALEIQANNNKANSIQKQYGLVGITNPVVGIAPKGPPSSIEQYYASGKAILEANGANRTSTSLSDQMTARDIRYQLEKLALAPPLTLLINPKNLSTSYASVQKFSDRTRYGFVFERWGEEQVKLNFSGTTGAFIAAENSRNLVRNPTETSTPTGVQFASKRNSAAFQNFTALYQFYRNNGYLYDTLGRTQAHLAIGALAIDYDQFTYIGHMENFSYSYKVDTPHRIEWEIEFIVDRLVDRAGQPGALGPMRAPYVNPLTGSISPVTPTVQANTSSLTSPASNHAQTPWELLKDRR
jgi:hypothetical protein